MKKKDRDIPIYGFINDDGIIYENTMFISKQYAIGVYESLNDGWYPIIAHIPFANKYAFIVRFKRVVLRHDPFEQFTRYPDIAQDDIVAPLDIGQENNPDSDSIFMDVFDIYKLMQMLHTMKFVYLDSDIQLGSNQFRSIMPIVDIGKPYSDFSERFKLSKRIFPSKAYAKRFCGIEAYNPNSGIKIEKITLCKKEGE